MKTPLAMAMAGLLLIGGTAAGQTGTKGREAAVAAETARQAQESRLKAQLAEWQKIRAGDWAEAQRKKKEYDEYVRTHPPGSSIDLIPTRVIDKSAAEAQQATGRVEMADRIIGDVEHRLKQLGPAAPQQGTLTPREAAVATLAEKEAEGTLLSGQQAAWQPIRAEEWQTELRKKQVYEEYARQHPDVPIDRSGAEANEAAGRVESLDRFLAATSGRLAALQPEIKAARAALGLPAGGDSNPPPPKPSPPAPAPPKAAAGDQRAALEARMNELRERHRALKAVLDASGGHDAATAREMQEVYQEYLEVKKRYDALKK